MNRFSDHLWHQQEIIKAMRIRRMLQEPCYDREMDLKEILTAEFVDTNGVAVAYPISTN
jgi:hypothetical protein